MAMKGSKDAPIDILDSSSDEEAPLLDSMKCSPVGKDREASVATSLLMNLGNSNDQAHVEPKSEDQKKGVTRSSASADRGGTAAGVAVSPTSSDPSRLGKDETAGLPCVSSVATPNVRKRKAVSPLSVPRDTKVARLQKFSPRTSDRPSFATYSLHPRVYKQPFEEINSNFYHEMVNHLYDLNGLKHVMSQLFRFAEVKPRPILPSLVMLEQIFRAICGLNQVFPLGWRYFEFLLENFTEHAVRISMNVSRAKMLEMPLSKIAEASKTPNVEALKAGLAELDYFKHYMELQLPYLEDFRAFQISQHERFRGFPGISLPQLTQSKKDEALSSRGLSSTSFEYWFIDAKVLQTMGKIFAEFWKGYFSNITDGGGDDHFEILIAVAKAMSSIFDMTYSAWKHGERSWNVDSLCKEFLCPVATFFNSGAQGVDPMRLKTILQIINPSFRDKIVQSEKSMPSESRLLEATKSTSKLKFVETADFGFTWVRAHKLRQNVPRLYTSKSDANKALKWMLKDGQRIRHVLKHAVSDHTWEGIWDEKRNKIMHEKTGYLSLSSFGVAHIKSLVEKQDFRVEGRISVSCHGWRSCEILVPKETVEGSRKQLSEGKSILNNLSRGTVSAFSSLPTSQNGTETASPSHSSADADNTKPHLEESGDETLEDSVEMDSNHQQPRAISRSLFVAPPEFNDTHFKAFIACESIAKKQENSVAISAHPSCIAISARPSPGLVAYLDTQGQLKYISPSLKYCFTFKLVQTERETMDLHIRAAEDYRVLLDDCWKNLIKMKPGNPSTVTSIPREMFEEVVLSPATLSKFDLEKPKSKEQLEAGLAEIPSLTYEEFVWLFERVKNGANNAGETSSVGGESA